MNPSLPTPREPIADQQGIITRAWYAFLAQFQRNFAGSETVPGSGLTEDNGALGIADGGVTNDKLRDSLALSVIGRPFASDGTPQDIQAGANGWFLQCDNDQVTFRIPRLPSYTVATVPSASGVGAGSIVYVPDESGGATIAFSNGTNWLRAQDRAIIS